ncbi:hypothetical protein UlMin_037782 [Ulmus minor]
MEGASMVRIDRKSSIETEPRTLDMNQIHIAREAALYVLKTRTVEEALSIFTQGLEPVASVVGQNRRMDIPSEKFDEYGGDHLEVPEFRDVVSAPF